MTAFDQLSNHRTRSRLSDQPPRDPLIHELLPEIPRGSLPRFPLGEGVLVCQAGGGRLPAMDQNAGTELNNAIAALFGGGVLTADDRNRHLEVIQGAWGNFLPTANMTTRGPQFAQELTRWLARNGNVQQRRHVTYVAAEGNRPARLEFRQQAGGDVLGDPINIFPQNENGVSVSLALARIRRNENQDFNTDDWRHVITQLNSAAGTGQDRQTRLQAFINEQINPYLHWAREGEQNFGWNIRLANAGPPIQIEFQQWHSAENRLLRINEQGYAAVPPITLPENAAPGNQPDRPTPPGNTTGGGVPPLIPQAAIDEALWYLKALILGTLGIQGFARLQNHLRNRSERNNNNAQAELARTRTEAIRGREARMAQRATERPVPQRIEVEVAEGVRRSMTPEQYARHVEELQRRVHAEEVTRVRQQITELEEQLRTNPNHPESAQRRQTLEALNTRRTALGERLPRETTQVTREPNGRLRISILGRTLGVAAVLAIVTSVFANNNDEAPRLPTVPN